MVGLYSDRLPDLNWFLNIAASHASPTLLTPKKSAQIDYHATNAKPPLSYAQLIIDAMAERQVEKITLSEIYEYAARRYAYYRSSKGPWKNSIRHNLSCNQLFKRVPRQNGEKGKGSYWTINDSISATSNIPTRKGRSKSTETEENSMSKPSSRVNSAVLQYMDSIRNRQMSLPPQNISLFDEPASAMWDDQVFLNCDSNSPTGSSVQMDLSEPSLSDIGFSSDDQCLSSDHNWQSDFASYEIDGCGFVGQFEEFHYENINIDPNTPPQWQDVDQYYDELIRLEGEEHL
ncbi:unnamed protein product [Nippostrongylus brasiliensis]|uniref:PES-1 protein (inferred by orthology to a C. elegans protein) n=1 Tax=Nippostrongylus brasiliensis TaxID=27835 RepID=A0A0N4XTH4_NIPBR|nr:unnamed protein product [Nippostrongylus brasiliensis]